MACRVGISTNPHERIAHWMRVEGHTRWEILAEGLTYEQANDLETTEAIRGGCRSKEGGQKVAGYVYSVYHVWGGW